MGEYFEPIRARSCSEVSRLFMPDDSRLAFDGRWQRYGPTAANSSGATSQDEAGFN
jgi:hypothetical protein